MGKEVLVTVKSTLNHEWGDTDNMEFITLGSMFFKNNSIYLMYNESEISGMEGTTTTLKAEPKRVTLNRMGMAELKHVFEEGIHNEANYITPYGTMISKVLPSKVEVDLTEIGGSINLEYELLLGEKKVSFNELSITVEEV